MRGQSMVKTNVSSVNDIMTQFQSVHPNILIDFNELPINDLFSIIKPKHYNLVHALPMKTKII